MDWMKAEMQSFRKVPKEKALKTVGSIDDFGEIFVNPGEQRSVFLRTEPVQKSLQRTINRMESFWTG